MDSNHRSPECLSGVVAPGPRDHCNSEFGGRNSEPAHSFRLPNAELPSGRSGSRTRPLKVMSLHGALAHLRHVVPPSALRIPTSQLTKGRLELPMPRRLGALDAACLPIAPLGRLPIVNQKSKIENRVTHAGVEPA